MLNKILEVEFYKNEHASIQKCLTLISSFFGKEVANLLTKVLIDRSETAEIESTFEEIFKH